MNKCEVYNFLLARGEIKKNIYIKVHVYYSRLNDHSDHNLGVLQVNIRVPTIHAGWNTKGSSTCTAGISEHHLKYVWGKGHCCLGKCTRGLQKWSHHVLRHALWLRTTRVFQTFSHDVTIIYVVPKRHWCVGLCHQYDSMAACVWLHFATGPIQMTTIFMIFGHVTFHMQEFVTDSC